MNPKLLFNTAWAGNGFAPDEFIYFERETNSPIFLPVHIGRIHQLTRIIKNAPAQPSVRSESAPVARIERRPIATPKFHAKLISHPIYLGILPVSSNPSGSPLGRMRFSPSGFAFFAAFAALAGFAAFATAFFGCAFFATALFGCAFFATAFAGFSSSRLSTLSSNPIFLTLTIHCSDYSIYFEIFRFSEFTNSFVWHCAK